VIGWAESFAWLWLGVAIGWSLRALRLVPIADAVWPMPPRLDAPPATLRAVDELLGAPPPVEYAALQELYALIEKHSGNRRVREVSAARLLAITEQRRLASALEDLGEQRFALAERANVGGAIAIACRHVRAIVAREEREPKRETTT
jgi:hypothetical protein